MSARLPLADIRLIARFVKFCRSKGDERYNFCDSTSCAVAQFTGNGKVLMSGFSCDGERIVPIGVMEAVASWPHTFSALADRLEALLADAPAVSKVSA